MATRYEYYIVNDDNVSLPYGANGWRAQTFTPSVTHTITSVKLLLYRVGSPGTLTVCIQGVDGSSHPDGSDLCSGTTDGDTLTTNTAGEWREITLGAGTPLTASTKYAIILKALSGDSSNKPGWRADSSSPAYAGGAYETTADAGANWTTVSTYDFMFEDWGTASTDYPISTSCGLTASATIDRDVAWDRGTSPGLTSSITVAYKAAWDRGTSPGLTVSATIAKALGRLITTTANLTISSTVAKALAYKRTTTANLTTSVTVARSRARTIVTTTGLTVSTTIAKSLGYIRASSPGLTASVSVAVNWAFVKFFLRKKIVNFTLPDREMTFTLPKRIRDFTLEERDEP